MNPLNPLFAVLCLLLAFGTAHLLMRVRGAPSESGRFASIDGLRGFLAFSVFIHHASIWYFYLPTDIWDSPPSPLYTLLGQVSVELFFMITAFLFIHKVAASSRQISWPTLFIHRLFRLGPLYLLAMACFLTLVAYLSNWRLDGSPLRVGIEALRWVVFAVGGLENVNHLPMTYVVIAGVPWSLQYEWAFYLSLPFIALGLRRKASFWTLAACAVLLAVASVKLSESGRYFYAFTGGAAAAYAIQFPRLCRFARSRAGSAVVVIALLAVWKFYDSAYIPGAIVLLTLVMTLVACGADLFGLLTRPTSFFFGEAAYSLYLLHPLLLSIAFKLLLPRWAGTWTTPLLYWSVILVITPLLVWLATSTFRWIERPGIEAGRRVDAWRLSRMARDPQAVGQTSVAQPRSSS